MCQLDIVHFCWVRPFQVFFVPWSPTVSYKESLVSFSRERLKQITSAVVAHWRLMVVQEQGHPEDD